MMPYPRMARAYPPFPVLVLPDAAGLGYLGLQRIEAEVVVKEPHRVVGQEIDLSRTELAAEPELRMGRDGYLLAPSVGGEARYAPALQQADVAEGVVPDTYGGFDGPGVLKHHAVRLHGVAPELVVVVLDPEVAAAVPQGDAELAVAVEAFTLDGPEGSRTYMLAEDDLVGDYHDVAVSQQVEHVEGAVRGVLCGAPEAVLVLVAVEVDRLPSVHAEPEVVVGQQSRARADI